LQGYLFFHFHPYRLPQVRGKALYEKLSKDRDLIKPARLERYSWLPDGTGLYFKEEENFKKIDIKTGKKKNLFDEGRIISEYNKLTGKNLDKLPFEYFEFIKNGNRIRFKVKSKAFIYDLGSGEGSILKCCLRTLSIERLYGISIFI